MQVKQINKKLAIDGGKSSAEKIIPFNRASIGEEEKAEMIATLESGWITKGPRTKKFEANFAGYVKAKHAVGVFSCTSAIHLALMIAGIKEGDEVITTPITFPSVINEIVHCHAEPVFVDVEPDTLNINADKIEEKITEKTKAIIPVHFSGYPCDMDKIMELAKKYNLTVIEDAAHAVETEYKGRKVGSIGDMTCFSFYATKNITTGEGGMFTTNNPEYAKMADILSLHGMTQDAWKRYSDEEGFKHWDIVYPGYKCNMFDIQAALGLTQLKKIDKLWEMRKKVYERYNEAFAGFPDIIIPPPAEIKDMKLAYHLYIIQVKTENLKASRDMVINALTKENIGIGIHFRSIFSHPYFKDFKKEEYPNADYIGDRVISLPLYPSLSEKDQDTVIEAVKKVVSYYRK
ncbi:MAG: DegT/DnrJ/EryC1/StrS aminotransferase family protein [Armatimonadota bacterium]